MPPANTLTSLDQLISDVGGLGNPGTQSGGSRNLLIEHLRSARTSLLGCMPGEYRSSLEEAKESVACIPDKKAQIELKRRLQILISA